MTNPFGSAARIGRVYLPPGSDDIIRALEGAGRRMSDGRISFDWSPRNEAIIRSRYPDIEIEIPNRVRPLPLIATDDTPNSYTLRTKPIGNYQLEGIRYIAPLPAVLLAWEQGLGKTKAAIDKAGRHWARGEIDAVMVITLKGVHEQWFYTQIPQHLGLAHGRDIPWRGEVWNGRKNPWAHSGPPNAPFRRMEWFLTTFGALGSNVGQDAILAFMARHVGKVMVIIDESHNIKSPHSARTEACIALGRNAVVRLALSGTPLAKSLQDEWSQSLFLDETIFGFRYVSTFNATYSDTIRLPGGVVKVEAKNVEQFQRTMAPYIHRVSKANSGLDLPEKIYDRFVFDLSKEQRKHYDALRKNFLTVLDSGERVTVQNAAVALLRCQQITCGRLVNEDGTIHDIENARVAALENLLNKFTEEDKIIIWSRFKADFQNIKVLASKHGGAVEMVQEQNQDERRHNADRFMNDPSVKFLLSSPPIAGTGYNFQGKCRTMIYYSNSFNSIHRWQSEDRIHRIGTKDACLYIDITARQTVDGSILTNLRKKKELADLALGDIKTLFMGE